MINVCSARASAHLPAAVVASPEALTCGATCLSTPGGSNSSKQLKHGFPSLSCRLTLVSDLCRCKFVSCTKTFFHASKLKRHVRFAHGDKNKYFKVCVNILIHQMAPKLHNLHQFRLLLNRFSSLVILITCAFPSYSASTQTALWPSKSADCLRCTWRNIKWLPSSSKSM